MMNLNLELTTKRRQGIGWIVHDAISLNVSCVPLVISRNSTYSLFDNRKRRLEDDRKRRTNRRLSEAIPSENATEYLGMDRGIGPYHRRTH